MWAIGALHGLAGGSHFLGLLPALAFPSAIDALIYLLAYGLGTIVAMAGFSFLVAWVARGFALQGARAYQALLLICSTAATVMGGIWLRW